MSLKKIENFLQNEKLNGEQLDVDATARLVQRQGYAVLPEFFDLPYVSSAKEEILSHINYTGRNDFEGKLTQRVYSLVAKTRRLDDYFSSRLLLSIVTQLLGATPLLSRTQGINILPQEKQQRLHRDDVCYPPKRPRPTYGVSVMLALDEFTDQNGATLVVPNSHQTETAKVDSDQAISIIMPAGSILIMLSETIHAGGANYTSSPRLAAFAHYCLPWLRQLDNPFLSFDRNSLREISPELQQLLGYGTHEENGIHFGVVDGTHPLKTLNL